MHLYFVLIANAVAVLIVEADARAVAGRILRIDTVCGIRRDGHIVAGRRILASGDLQLIAHSVLVYVDVAVSSLGVDPTEVTGPIVQHG